jgi:hypothetical protein
MNKLSTNQNGFIPMLIGILLIVLAIIYIAYTRVLHAKG